jgi:DNA polymerase-3 subunit gamma/tau
MTESDQEELREQAREAGREKLQQVLNVLIRREEDLRFTSSPRLILETLLIKLCSMGEILGFDELMEKLETLERRLAGDSTASYPPPKETPAASVGEPAAAAARADDADPHTEAGEDVPRSETGGGWDDFMSFLGERNSAMANMLRQWRFEGLEGETLRIERGKTRFYADYLDDQDHMNRFTELAREFFGDKVRVLVTGDKRPEAKTSGGKPGARAGRKPKAKADLPKPVQDVMHLFQGEVKEEIPATPGEGEEPGSQ